MASTSRAPRKSAAEKAAEKAALTQPDAGLTTSDEQAAGEAQTDIDAMLGLAGTDPLPGKQTGEQVAPALAERQRRAAEAKQKRDAEKKAVAERAEQVAAEQAANPAPKKGKAEPTAEQVAKRKAESERVAKVIEMRKAGSKLGEIATALGYSSQQVVSGVLRRHAPDLQVRREAGTGGITLTPEQVTELQELETRYGAKLATLTKALARATAAPQA